MERIYVASSWRNPVQTGVVAALRAAGFWVYDFKHPAPGNEGFHWSEVMPSYPRVGEGSPEPLADEIEYIAALNHPTAVEGFGRDFEAMQGCDTCVLVLPCGRSAHLELGWFAGNGRKTAVLLDGPKVVPELMYKLCDYVAPSLFHLLTWMGLDGPEVVDSLSECCHARIDAGLGDGMLLGSCSACHTTIRRMHRHADALVEEVVPPGGNPWAAECFPAVSEAAHA